MGATASTPAGGLASQNESDNELGLELLPARSASKDEASQQHHPTPQQLFQEHTTTTTTTTTTPLTRLKSIVRCCVTRFPVLVVLVPLVIGSVLAKSLLFSGSRGRQVKRAPASSSSDLGSCWNPSGEIHGDAVDDTSGAALALSGDGRTLAIGSPWNDGHGKYNGQVRVYSRRNNSPDWSKLGNDILGVSSHDNAGSSVAISSDGNIVAVGSPMHEGAAGRGSGHVRVFVWDDDDSNTDWTQRGDEVQGEYKLDQFGYSVALSSDGTVLAVGAPDNDGNGSASGHVRVYEFKYGKWGQRGVDIDGESDGDRSGSSVALSADGNILAVGAPFNNGPDADVSRRGHVRLYQWRDGKWTQRGQNIDGLSKAEKSGTSVALSADGSVVAVGSPESNQNGDKSGHVWVYEYNVDIAKWTTKGDVLPGEAAQDQSGTSVSLSSDGNFLAVGAPRHEGGGGGERGSGDVRVYEYNARAWKLRGGDVNGEASNDKSGTSVSISADGSLVAVGAPYNDRVLRDSGSVRTYNYGKCRA